MKHAALVASFLLSFWVLSATCTADTQVSYEDSIKPILRQMIGTQTTDVTVIEPAPECGIGRLKNPSLPPTITLPHASSH